MNPANTVQVGPVVGQGDHAHQVVSIGNWRLRVFSTATDEPRLRDLDLAKRLGYDRPRKIRDLIKRLLDEGKLRDVKVCPTVGQTSGGRPGEEFWLTEAQALKVTAKSETDQADALLDEMIEIFRLAIHGLLSPGQARSAEVRLRLFLLDERRQVERFLSTELIQEICRLYQREHQDGDRPPRFFRMVAERIYKAVFGTDVHGELQRRGNKRKYYELLTEGAHKLAQGDLRTLETLARGSFTTDEFWMRVEAEFRGSGVQGKLPLAC